MQVPRGDVNIIFLGELLKGGLSIAVFALTLLISLLAVADLDAHLELLWFWGKSAGCWWLWQMGGQSGVLLLLYPSLLTWLDILGTYRCMLLWTLPTDGSLVAD